MNNKSILLFTILLAVHSSPHSATVIVSGTNGNNGVNGSVGDPATSGTSGESGFVAVAEVATTDLNQDTSNTAIAEGANGGNGGNGGNGANVSPSLWANGGDGGDGGRGGDAIANASTTISSPGAINSSATASGGRGGGGGLAGIQSASAGIFDGFSGQDGSGGQGGDASAGASASNGDSVGGASASATAIGGTGGGISPNNRLGLSQGFEPTGFSVAGDGGNASLSSVYAESLGRGRVDARGSVVGGRGGAVSGNTQSGGSASGTIRSGSGASVSLANAVDGATAGNMLLRQDATGGDAGSQSTQTGYGELGNAGSASSSLSKTTTSDSLFVGTSATGGSGGDFTILNLIPVDGLPPIGGSAIGGDGAAATAFSSAINLGGDATAAASATGGQGGDARSLVNADTITGGNGGEAAATAYAESVGGTAAASAAQTGGNGGNSLGPDPFSPSTNNGAGADSILLDAVSGRSDVLLRLDQTAVGGNGSVGGNARSTLTASNPGGGNILGRITARGGTGTDNSGANGGNADVAADLTAQGDVSIVATSIGGNGSSSRDIISSSNGGSANLGPLTGTSLNGGAVLVNGLARGGNGGYRANGVGVSLVDIVNGSTTGALSFNQTAFGGGGGNADNRVRGAASGLGGEAFSSLTSATGEASELTIVVSSNGGVGGNVSAGVAADGALGTANASGTNTGGSTDISSGATGGRGGSAQNSSSRAFEFSAGGGGNAVATADSTVFDGALGTDATVGADSIGGQGGSVVQVVGGVVNNLTTEGGDGGNASSISIATANSASGFGALSSRSTAYGGSGSTIRSERIAQAGEGGDAFAQATSVFNAQFSNQVTTATAIARGGRAGFNRGAGLDGRGGSATAVAEVIGAANALSTAAATPGVLGGGVKRLVTGSASATARITDGSGTAQAQIRDGFNSTAGLFVAQATVTATTQGTSPLAGSNAEAIITLSGSRSGSVATSIQADASLVAATANNTASVVGLESVSRVDILPDATAFNQALNGNTDIASNFDLGGGSDLLALMSIGAMQNGSLDSNGFSNSISLSLDMSQLSTQQDLLFGFMNPVFTGNGFDSMTFQIFQEDLLVVDELFANVFSAETFFTDQTLNLGDWTQGLVGELDLRFLIDFDISGIGDGFYFDVAYGNSTIGSGASVVPVPTAVWLFASGLISLVFVGRRREVCTVH